MKKSNMLSSVLLGLALIVFAHGAQAEEKAAKPAQPEKSPIAVAAEEFTKGFNEDSSRHFSIVYSNYNMIKVVETVENDVGLAVDKCGEVHADMKAPLQDRYKLWKDGIEPIVKQAEEHVNTMVLSQEYAKPSDIRDFFKKIDKERKAHDKDVKKVPVTSKEACEFLLKTMDSTQEQLTSLLQATLVSTPQAVQRALEEEQAAQKAEAEKLEAETKAQEEKAKQEPKTEKPAEKPAAE